MSGLFGLLQTTKLTIFAQEMSLGVLNHNVANADTPGYHRQRLNVSAAGNLVGFGAVGGGISIDGVQRFTNRFVENQLGRVKADHGEQSALARNYSLMETIFGEPVDDVLGEQSLGDVIGDFFNAWQPAVNPELDADDTDTRALILEAARTLGHRFNVIAGNLQDQAQDLRESIADTVGEVNTLLDQVAELNLELGSSSLGDSARADLSDSRLQKLNQLSALTGADWQFTEQGQLKVYIGGRAVVDHVTVHGLETRLGESGRVRGMGIHPIDDDFPLSIPGGELKAMTEMLSSGLPEVIGRLDELAAHLIERVNALHQAADGDGGGGLDLFTGADASTIAINPVLADHPELVSLSGLLPDGRDIASAMFDLHTESIDEEAGLTIEGMYAGLIGHIGSRSASTTQLAYAAERLEEGLQTQLESEVGVNIDEELAEMMIVQTTYQAASKVIAAVDELLDILLSVV